MSHEVSQFNSEQNDIALNRHNLSAPELPVVYLGPNRTADELVEQRADLLAACKTAQKAIYAAINGNKSKLSHAHHDLEQAIAKAEGN